MSSLVILIVDDPKRRVGLESCERIWLSLVFALVSMVGFGQMSREYCRN